MGGITGSVYLGPVGQFFLTGGALSTASAHTTVLLAPTGFIPVAAATKGIKVYFQAYTKGANVSAVDLTNMPSVHY